MTKYTSIEQIIEEGELAKAVLEWAEPRKVEYLKRGKSVSPYTLPMVEQAQIIVDLLEGDST